MARKRTQKAGEPAEEEILEEEKELVEELQPEVVEEPVPSAEEAALFDDLINELQNELQEVRAKADEYLDGWQRSRAEFANYKKRVEREQAQVHQVAAGSIIKRYLEVLDDLERALRNRPQDGEGATWADGVELVYRKLQSILESEGVKPIQAQGQYFDPNFHEAVTSEERDGYESGQIIEVLQQGYLLGERVLRPAVVRVAK